MKTKVLFFIDGSLPTEAEITSANSIKGKVCFRNATMVGDDHKPEDCDYVCGHVPEAYSDFQVWEFEAEKKSETVKVVQQPKIKPESKTQVAGWKPNA